MKPYQTPEGHQGALTELPRELLLHVHHFGCGHGTHAL
jgi:hypothetical protein